MNDGGRDLPLELASHMRAGEEGAQDPKGLLLRACKKQLGHAYLLVVDEVPATTVSATVQRKIIVHADHVDCLQAGAYFSLHEPEWISLRPQTSDAFGVLAGQVNAALTGESVEGGGSAPSHLWRRPRMDDTGECVLVVTHLLSARVLEHAPEETEARQATLARRLSAQCPSHSARAAMFAAHTNASILRDWKQHTQTPPSL